MTPYVLRDELFLWWLADPAQPRYLQTVRGSGYMLQPD